MSKKKQAMALFKEYGTESIKRIDKILELEKPIMIDFSDIESACNTHGDDFYDFCKFRTCIHSQREMDFCPSWSECQANFMPIAFLLA